MPPRTVALFLFQTKALQTMDKIESVPILKEIAQYQRHYILDREDGKTAIPCPDFVQFAYYFAYCDVHVALTMQDGVDVSTVFLGRDINCGTGEPPALFETMIFGGEYDGCQWRCSTWDEARLVHKAVCKMLGLQYVEEKLPRPGELVLATEYHDGDPRNAWGVGYYDGGDNRGRHWVVDQSGLHLSVNGFRKVEKVSRDRGLFLIENAERIEQDPHHRGLWWWKRSTMGEPALTLSLQQPTHSDLTPGE